MKVEMTGDVGFRRCTYCNTLLDCPEGSNECGICSSCPEYHECPVVLGVNECSACLEDLEALSNLKKKGYLFGFWQDIYEVGAREDAHHGLNILVLRHGVSEYFTAEFLIANYSLFLSVCGSVLGHAIQAAALETAAW